MRTDYLIVGSGLTGAVIARLLADAGREVAVLDRRAHLGGNVHDQMHTSGIRVHSYGPHYFRTNSDDIWRFVNRFVAFYKYEAILKTWVDGEYENWPILASYIRRQVGDSWTPNFTGSPTNFEEASLAMMPQAVYDKFVKGYSEKQWGVSARLLEPSLAKRFEVSRDNDPRLMRCKYQGLPVEGYSGMMEKILAGIPVILDCDYLRNRGGFEFKRMLIFTGPIDEFFEYTLGRLKYRGQMREHCHLADVAFAQPCAQVNNPDPANGPHIRTIEWKHLMPAHTQSQLCGTLLTRETPHSPSDPNQYEYPFPDKENGRVFERYRRQALAIPKVVICGRLGEYRYYDMDQAIGRAITLAKRVLGGTCETA